MGGINDFAQFSAFLNGYQSEEQAQKSTDSNVRYYGFINREGAWYIQEQTKSGTSLSWKYVKGNSDFTTTWAARESQTYQSWDTAFK